jgi:hypothetical protein
MARRGEICAPDSEHFPATVLLAKSFAYAVKRPFSTPEHFSLNVNTARWFYKRDIAHFRCLMGEPKARRVEYQQKLFKNAEIIGKWFTPNIKVKL